MPDFVPTYTPTDGDVLAPASLNNNFYKLTAGSSIYEVSNGNIDTTNFDPAFEVQPHHVRPGQTGDAISVGQVLSNDYFSDLWTGNGAGYIPVVGAAVTFYQKYDVTMAMFFASCFVTCWRQFGKDNAAFATRLAAPDIHVRTFFGTDDGGVSTLQHTQREMPQTVFFDSASADPAGQISTAEADSCHHLNLSHPRILNAASPCDQLLKGWHTFGLAVLVPQNLSGQDTGDANGDMTLRLNGAATADGRPAAYYSAVQRIRFYCRSVSAIRLL